MTMNMLRASHSFSSCVLNAKREEEVYDWNLDSTALPKGVAQLVFPDLLITSETRADRTYGTEL